MPMRFFLLLILFSSLPLAADMRTGALASMRKGARFMRSISAEGGYLWRYSSDLKLVAGEVKASRTMIWIQPPGTPSVGEAFLKAYEATGDAYLLDCALAVGDCLAMSQLASGGWDYRFDFASPQRWYRQVDRGKL
ncbi:MAG: pectate lyase, partial [Verrucomicrobiota bacterium]|nr:pectate lyase [Verrucomicrobiota bacterium]